MEKDFYKQRDERVLEIIKNKRGITKKEIMEIMMYSEFVIHHSIKRLKKTHNIESRKGKTGYYFNEDKEGS